MFPNETFLFSEQRYIKKSERLVEKPNADSFIRLCTDIVLSLTRQPTMAR